MDKTKLTAAILAVVALLVVGISYFQNQEKDEENKINIVENYSEFYTVDSCVYRFTTYLSSNDTESILLSISDSYKEKNNINENNVIDKFTSVEEDSIFVAQKMYYEIINKNVTKYYVYGNIQKNQIFDNDIINTLEKTSMYLIVYLDKENKTFSIEPYDGKIFINGDNYEE